MDIQHFLAINVSVITALTLVASLLGSQNLGVSWIAVNALVLAATLGAMATWPEMAGTIGLVLFVPLILGPLLLSRMAQVRVGQRRLADAARFARLAAVLHPTPGARFFADVIGAQSAATPAAQKEALVGLADRYGPAEQLAVKALILRMEARWEEVLGLLASDARLLASMPAVKIRALGETGRLDQMTRAYDDAKAHLHGQSLVEAQLVMLAFAGRVAEVGSILAGPLARFDAEYKAYWQAIAQRAVGHDETVWRAALQGLAINSGTAATREAARRALEQPTSGPVVLDEVSSVIVGECVDRLHRAEADTGKQRFTPMTWALLSAIVAGYVLSEMSGGSQNMRTLVDLGALWPPYVTRRGEWWRLATALFLHWGALHAGVNCFMLVVLGRLCERMFGSLRMISIYLLGGLASSGFVVWLATTGEPSVLVGASGAIMALFGGLVGRSVITWLRSRDSLDGRNLVLLGVIALLQVIADLATPQVSLAAHASGFVAGIVIGTLMSLRARRR